MFVYTCTYSVVRYKDMYSTSVRSPHKSNPLIPQISAFFVRFSFPIVYTSSQKLSNQHLVE